MSNVLEAALSYARRGWHILPIHGVRGNDCACGNAVCGSPGKHPILHNGLDGATTDEATIRGWYEKWPNANVAIRTGKISGVIVLDFDGPQGLKTAEALSTGPTPRSITGSGGRHWLCACPPGFDVPNSTKKLPGMDVRGERGYIVAPPSMHAIGAPYAWEQYLSPTETDPAPLPDTVLQLLAPEEKALAISDVSARAPAENYVVGRARRYLEKMRPGVAGEGGHTQTFRAAVAAVRGFGLDRAQALDVMRDYNKRCVPPWTDDDLVHKIDDALRQSKTPDGYIVKRDEGVAVAHHESANWHDGVVETVNRQFGRTMPVADLTNASLFLKHVEPYKERLRLDTFADQIQISDGDRWKEINDVDVLRATVWLQHPAQDCRVEDTLARKAMTLVAADNPHNPVYDYLSGLTWDGKPRIEDWLIRLAGAPDTRYTRAVSSKWLISAVARIYKPGCRADTVLILEGAQGARKSTAVGVLGGQWTSTMSNSSLGSKDAMEQLRGRWIVEMAELDVMSKAEVSTAKDFITRTSDYYRPSYGHFAKNFPRQCVFAGTVNHDSYLRDETGGRRFWPVPIKSINTAGLAAERDQLWAEAVAKFQEGEEWWLGPEDEALAVDEQDQRQVTDSWEETISRWLDGRIADAPLLQHDPDVSIGDILSKALEIPVKDHERTYQTRVGAILTRLRWRKYRAVWEGKRMTRYRPPEKAAA